MKHDELLHHMQWADASVWVSVMASQEAREDSELKERLHHIHVVQWAFLQIWRQEEMKVRELEDFEASGDLLTWARRYYREMMSFVADLDASDLEGEVRLPWRKDLKERFGEIRPTYLGETMTQVALHTMHHRGQVTTRLRALDVEPPLIDYIAWLWQGRPLSQWP